MILKMKKAVVVCLKEDRDELLTRLQAFGFFMPTEEGEDVRLASTMAKLRETEKLYGDMADYTKKKGMFSSRPEVYASELLESDPDAESLRDEISGDLALIDQKKREADDARSYMDSLEMWLPLDDDTENVRSSDYVTVFTGTIPSSMESDARELLSAFGAVSILGGNEKKRAIVAVSAKSDSHDMEYGLSRVDFTPEPLPITHGRVKDVYGKAEQTLASLEKELDELRAELTRKCESSSKIEKLLEITSAKAERESVAVSETSSTAYIKGWVPEEEEDRLKKAVASVSEATEVMLSDPEEGETPPTLTKNNKFVAPFETITDMYSRPGYGTIDPNPVMGLWYWVIFGMMMADAGYGILMVAIGLLMLKLMKPRGSTKKLLTIITFSGFTTFVFGVLFGSYFGASWFPPIVFSPMQEPMSMLIFSLVVGMLHIFSGMAINMAASIRAGKWYDAIFDQLSWMILIVGAGLMLVGYSSIGTPMLITGAAIILFTAGRAKKGIIGKVAGGLGGLYNVTGYLSDILSYSRILALGMSSAVIGMVMNLLAGMVKGGLGGFGIVFSLLIYIIGHAFNLAMGLLSAYVHDSRLQYIEFFGKFYEGGGSAFAPLSIKSKYVDAKDDKAA